MEPYIAKLRQLFQDLPDKKRYFELLTAVLSVPVLITVIILNLNSLKNQKASQQPSPTLPPTVITIVQPTQSFPSPTPTPTPGVTVTPTPTATPTPTNTPTPTPTPAASSSGTLQ